MQKRRIGIDFHVASGIYHGVRTYLTNLIEAILKVENGLTYFIYAKNPEELSHDILFQSNLEFFPEYHRRLLKFFVSFSANRATRIISAYEFNKRQIIQYYRIPEEKITVKEAQRFRWEKKAKNRSRSIKRSCVFCNCGTLLKICGRNCGER